VVIRYNASSAIHLKVEKVRKVLPTLQLLLAYTFEVVASYFSSIIVMNSEQSRSELLDFRWLRPLRRKVVTVYETGRDLSLLIDVTSKYRRYQECTFVTYRFKNCFVGKQVHHTKRNIPDIGRLTIRKASGTELALLVIACPACIIPF